MMDVADASTRLCCMVCGCQDFVPFAIRNDDVQVVQCTNCGMGVIEPIPDDLMAFYGDDYYGIGQPNSESQFGRGYANYAFTAEHGVGWAAALVKLLRPAGGRVLDIGCADGHLLAKLGPTYAAFGIEANKATGRVASERGVAMLGRDVCDRVLIEAHRGSFDVITAIAVFEHLRDIRAGMETALRLLRNDGVLLFEVPLMSAVHDNTTWLNSSLEHVWYPTEQGLQRLVQTELGAELVGAEVFVTGYASTYVGLVFRGAANSQAIRGLADRILLPESVPSSPDESIARMLLHLVHAATATHRDVGALAQVPITMLNPQLMRRFGDLWQGDLWRLELAAAEIFKIQGRERRLKADLDVAQSDRVSSHTELTSSLIVAQGKLAAVQADLAARIAVETDFREQKAALDRDRAAANAALGQQRAEFDRDRAAADAVLAEARALRFSTAGRMVAVLGEAAQRFPRLARPASRLARVLWWTLRGRLISRLRLRQRVRAHLRADSVARVEPRAPSPNVGIQPNEAPAPAPNGRQNPIDALRPSPGHDQTPLVGPTSINHNWNDPPKPDDRLTDLSSTFFMPDETPPEPELALGQMLSLLEDTGHRPELVSQQERLGDWPLVSVVVTSFNYGQFVGDAVDSVLAQTFKDLEVIVVEGGSSAPASRFVVAGLKRPRTRVLMQGEGHRAGANRNFGISQARGRYICCLDADDTLAPTYLEKALFLLERHGYDVVSGGMEMIGAEYGQLDIMETPDLEDILAGNHVLTCAVFRRSLWKQAGGYRDVDNTVSGHVHEDWVFWVRLAALGARFRNLHRDPVLRYRIHPASLSRGSDVNPMTIQREMVLEVNRDVLQSVTEKVALSRRQASIQYGTPSTPPAPIVLDRGSVETQPPTLLLAMPFLILGGAERLLSSVVAHLVQSGWRVVIMTTIESGAVHGNTEAWFAEHTSEIFHLPRCLPPTLWEDFVHHLVRSRNVDILLVVGSAFVYDCLRGLKAAYPRLRIADLLFNTVGHTANHLRRRNFIDLIFVETAEVRDYLLAHGEDIKRVCQIESGVDLDALRPIARAEALVSQIKVAPDCLIVGFSGRWSEEKNPLGFVQIALLVDPALPICFIMTGTGHLRHAIEHAISNAGLPEGRFHLLGEVPDIAPVLGSFDLLVIPSILDGRPVVALEALALGVPVLASRVGALADLIRDGETGWLCEPNDLKAVAQRIEQAGRDRVSLKDMRRQARTYAEAQLDIRNMLAAYSAGLRSMLHEAQRYE